MYVGLEIDGTKFSGLTCGDCYNYKRVAIENHNHYRKEIENKMKEVFDVHRDEIRADSIENNWFPSVKSHIFLSHSHADEDKAMELSGYLKEKCDVDVFIDSCIWGYSDDLLKCLDNDYCKTRRNQYDYKRRNITTTQVHLILNMALAKMIYNTECFMFLKTSNSVLMKKGISSKETDSPWICEELLMSSIISRRSKEAHRGGDKFNHSIFEATRSFPQFIYDIDFMNFKKVGYNQLIEMALCSSEEIYSNRNISRAERFLDMLYSKLGIKEMKSINE